MMRRKSKYGLYFLLLLWAGVSMAYYVAGVGALREKWFHGETHANAPFTIGDDGLDSLTNEAKRAGLSKGDVLVSIEGQPFSGYAQLSNDVEHARPGDVMDVNVRHRNGQLGIGIIHLKRIEPPELTLPGLISYLTPVLCIPLLGLAIGYWVVAARPFDPNAWLVLALLTFYETSFGDLDAVWWGGSWSFIFGIWQTTVQIAGFPALLWFGLSFPERSRIDLRWPSLKWLILITLAYALAIALWFLYLHNFDVEPAARFAGVEIWAGRIRAWGEIVCVLIFLIAIFDHLHSASTPDARRRRRVLAIGSCLSLGGLLIILGVLPRFGYSPHKGILFEVAVPFMALFPLTLAYVLIVQRAMDVGVLLRIGTKYLLAKATLMIIEIAIATFLIVHFIIPMVERKQHQTVNVLLLGAVAGVLFRAIVLRESLSKRLQNWLDRKFFRESYNAEVILNELSEHARRFTETGALIETVSRRIAEVLHIQRLALWLRKNDVFHLQESFGFNVVFPVVLYESSAIVEELTRSNRPRNVYRERPEEWLKRAGQEERLALDETQAELLLPLPGRDRLMGVLALGPKRSEEPYTPTDVRLLQSVGTQTGLALEVSELAHSLAEEATHRERIKREMEIAREVQQRLFPQRVPNVEGVDLAGICRPALAVGGDYYDMIELRDNRLGLAIGDVSGKGIPAALLMASLRASLRGMALVGPGELGKLMENVNQLAYEASAENRYATLFFGIYDSVTQELRYVNAGHNAPILLRCCGPKEKNAIRLEATGLMVGLLQNVSYEEQSITLLAGDVLIAYTDGISEAMTVDEEEWGEERLLSAARTARLGSAEKIMQKILQSADDFAAGAMQGDDMTLLVMKVEEADSKQRPL